MGKNDGGPAFPQSGALLGFGDFQINTGRSLRDWFAGMALQGLVTRTDGDWTVAPTIAYQLADAMLAAREQSP